MDRLARFRIARTSPHSKPAWAPREATRALRLHHRPEHAPRRRHQVAVSLRGAGPRSVPRWIRSSARLPTIRCPDWARCGPHPTTWKSASVLKWHEDRGELVGRVVRNEILFTLSFPRRRESGAAACAAKSECPLSRAWLQSLRRTAPHLERLRPLVLPSVGHWLALADPPKIDALPELPKFDSGLRPNIDDCDALC